MSKPRTKSEPFFPQGYNRKLFSAEQRNAIANLILDYKLVVGAFMTVQGVEDTLSLYFAKDDQTDFDLSDWRKRLGRQDY